MNLKIVEVVVLMVAGICFVAWQFRDLRRAREITRRQRQAQQTPSPLPSTRGAGGLHKADLKSGHDGR